MDDPTPLRYELIVWCDACRKGQHRPETCPSGGLDGPLGRFKSAEDARSYVNLSAISTRTPMRFTLRGTETGEEHLLTGFRDSDLN